MLHPKAGDGGAEASENGVATRQNLCVEVLVLPVTDSAVDFRTARSGNTGSAGGNSPIFQGCRTNQSIGRAPPPVRRVCVCLTYTVIMID